MPQAGAQASPQMMLLSFLMLTLLGLMLAAWFGAYVWVSRGHRLLPPPRLRPVPWGMASVGAVILLWVIVPFTVLKVVNLAVPDQQAAKAPESKAGPSEKAAKSPQIPPIKQLVLLTFVNLLLLPLMPLVLRLLSGARLDRLGLPDPEWKTNIVRGIIACLLLTPVSYGIMLIAQLLWKPTAHPLEEALLTGFSGPVVAMAFLSAVCLAPITEEFFFRGILLGWLDNVFLMRKPSVSNTSPDAASDPEFSNPYEASAGVAVADPDVVVSDTLASDSPWSPPRNPPERSAEPPVEPERLDLRYWLPNILVSALFALAHAPQWPAPLPLFVLAMGLGELYRRTGSLVGPIVLHATFNGLSTGLLALYLLAGGTEPKEAPVPPPAEPAVVSMQAFDGDRQKTCAELGLANSRAGCMILYPGECLPGYVDLNSQAAHPGGMGSSARLIPADH